MDITILGNKAGISDSFRSAVEDKVTRLSRYFDGMDKAEVRFTEERNPRIAERETCEVTVMGHGHTVRAKASATDSLAAVDRVMDKLEHRLKKLKGRLVSRSHPRRNSSNGPLAQASTEQAPDELEPRPTRIVRTKQFAMKPMTPDEAVLQMELLGHDFFLFTNAETDRAAVVYQRQDGNIGLIDAC